MKKKIVFLVLSLLVCSCSSSNNYYVGGFSINWGYPINSETIHPVSSENHTHSETSQHVSSENHHSSENSHYVSSENNTPSSEILPLNSHQIKLNLQGGSYSLSSFTKVEDVALNIPLDNVPTQYNKVFYGWYEPNRDIVIKPGTSYYFDDGTQFYAMWGNATHECDHHVDYENVNCSKCNGVGTLPVYGEATCSNCNGTGMGPSITLCDNCKSLGHLSIYRCNKGHTIRASSADEYYTACPTCADLGYGLKLMSVSGHYDCPYCVDGEIKGPITTCTRCGGDGLATVETGRSTCKECSGVGTTKLSKRCTACLGEQVFGDDNYPTISSYYAGHVDIEVKPSYEYAVKMVDLSDIGLLDTMYLTNLSNLQYSTDSSYDLPTLKSGSGQCYLISMRKKNSGLVPNVPSRYAIINCNYNLFYRDEPVQHTYSYNLVDASLGKFESDGVERGHLKGLVGKELALVMAIDPANPYGTKISSNKYLPLTYYSLTTTSDTSTGQRCYKGIRVEKDDTKVYSSSSLAKFQFKYDHDYKSYMLYNSSLGKYLYGYVGSDGIYSLGFSVPSGARASDNHWTIQQTSNGFCYMYCLMLSSYYTSYYGYLSNYGGLFRFAGSDQCYPIFLAQ